MNVGCTAGVSISFSISLFAKLQAAVGWDTVPCGIPCRVGYRAVWDTVPCGIPCNVGYRATWVTTPGRSAKLKTVRRTACDQTSRAAHPMWPQRAQSRERCGARRFVLTAAMAAMLYFEAMAESVRAPSVRPNYPRSDSPFANTVISLGFSHYGRAWG